MAHVLIVEDEGVLRLALKRAMVEEGHTVVTAPDYPQGLAKLAAGGFAVCLLGIELDGGDGLDLLRRARAQGAGVKCILLTGAPTADTAAEAVRHGAFDYLVKPVKAPEVLRVVRLALENTRLEAERNRYAERVDRYRRNLEAVFNSVNEGIVVLDAALRIHQANQAFTAMLGLSAEPVTGRSIGDLLPGALAPARSAVEKTLAEGRTMGDVRVETWVPGVGEKVLVLATTPLVGGEDAEADVVMTVRDVTRLTLLEREVADQQPFTHMVAKSRAMRDVLALVENVAPTDATVLICGESGTGKELAAEALHYASARRAGPLIKVNCAALAEDILESELFGHVQGAFTSAVRDRVGRFEAADGGTILLDEIGDVPPRLQLRLLRVLQAREFERVGDSFPMRSDVRIIASTNQDLAAKIQEGQFREDLYFRLNVMRIEMPPLRERQEDIPPLVDDFCRRFNAAFKKEIAGVAPETMEIFMSCPWWGNVRELENCIERACIVCQDTTILPRHLPPELLGQEIAPWHTTPRVAPRARDLERDTVLDTLERTDWNVAKAARLLGVARNTVYHKMHRYNLCRPQ